MARPSKFTAAKAETILAAILEGASQAEAARRAGVGRRTIQEWLAKGRAETSGPFWSFAFRFGRRSRMAHRRKLRTSWARYHARKAESWQRFRSSREGWWMERLGPRLFWRRRLEWALEHDRPDTARVAAHRLAEALQDSPPASP